MTTRFQGNIHHTASGVLACLFQSHNFGVGRAGRLCIALPDYFTVLDDYSANGRIGTDLP
jgi:hypothetical protein